MSSPQKPSRIVQTNSGPVQGKTYTFVDGRSASAYLGIPYAEPPVGELRFKKPLPVKPWKETRNCCTFGASSYYKNPTHQIRASEDCLFLNVFTPELSDEQKDYPVLFYVHGGGFLLDSSTVLGDENICKHLCSRDAVVVTFNYRLGFFGFLTLETNETPGNYALWDMTMALQWTHDNIHAFGGNNQRITVFGQSAGCCGCGLFESFSAFEPSISTRNDYGHEFAIEYAKFLGFADNPEHDEDQRNAALLSFYKKAKAQSLALGIMPHPRFRFRSKAMIALGPVIDGDFFPKPLEELRKEAPNKPFLNGTTQFEGLLFSVGSLESNHHPIVQSMAAFFMRTLLTPSSFIGRHLFKKILQKKSRKNNTKPAHETYKPLVTKLFHQTRPDLSEDKAGEIIDQFLDPKLPDDEYVKKAIHIISDIMFCHGAYRFSKERTEQGSTVYHYSFHYYKPGSIGLMALLLPFEGPTHCLELPYLFGKSILSDFVPDNRDLEMLDKFSTYLIQFAKTGNPNNDRYPEKWEPFDPNDHDRYFLFDLEEHGMRDGYADKRLPVWDKIFEDHPRQLDID
ncbi:Carboxylic ester hydrolase [Aphelenchoides bicaudatus]|nr:Carboxylic ester hydrolase [Aphelenchoides bicaudatus]